MLVVLAAFGVYQRLWTFVGQRDYEAVVKGVVVATLVVVGAIALLHPVQTPPTFDVPPQHGEPGLDGGDAAGQRDRAVPAAALALLIGARFLVHLVVEGRVRNFRVAKGARDVLDRRRRRGRPAGRPRAGAQPAAADAPGRVHRRRSAQARAQGRARAARCSARPRPSELTRVLDEVEPDEVVIAIPSAPGTVRARVVAACRERGIPVRTTPTVFELLQDGAGQLRVTRQLREVQVEDMLGREPVRDGARARRRLPDRPGRDGDRRRRLDRQRAVPPDRPRRPAPAGPRRPRRGQPVRDSPRARGGASRSHAPCRCSPTARRRSACARSSPSTARRRLPRRRLQARRDDGDATRSRRSATTRWPRGSWPGSPASSASETFVLVSTDKAVKPATVMGASKALAEWAVEAAAATLSRDDATPQCASATCSAPPAPLSRSSAARSPPAVPSRSPMRA